MKTLTVIFIILFISELIWNPRLDFTREGDLLLWYGKSNRKHIKIF